MTEQRPAGENELPALDAIGRVVPARAAGFIVADGSSKAIVQCDGFRLCRVEVVERNLRVRLGDLGRAVREVQRDEMLTWQSRLHLVDRRNHSTLPVRMHSAAFIRLVAYLVIDVVERIQFADDPLRDSNLHIRERLFLQPVDFIPSDVPDAVDVIGSVHGRSLPQFLAVHRAKEGNLNDNAALAGARHEILQSREISLVPAGQIEFVAAIGTARRVTSSPGRRVAPRRRGQRVALNAKGAGNLSIGPAEEPSMIETMASEFVQVGPVVEIEVDDRTVMLARGDQHRRLPAKLKVVRVLGMETQQIIRRIHAGRRRVGTNVSRRLDHVCQFGSGLLVGRRVFVPLEP